MAFNKNSNSFTLIFASALVVVVGVILASISVGLSDKQDKNKRDKQMMDILKAIKPSEEVTRENAQQLYDKYVQEALLVSGKDKGKVEAFDVNIQKEFRNQQLPASDRNFPLYVCEKEGSKYYVIPMVGKGLWGPIWGYVALEDDKTTIYGATFDHKGETPGLGAEIRTDIFQSQFEGETVATDIVVVKDGSGKGINAKVDGITGGTITSVGVEEMVNRTLAVYTDYFKNQIN